MQSFIHSPVVNIIKKALMECSINLKRDFNEIGFLRSKNTTNFIVKAQQRAFDIIFDILQRSNTSHGFIFEDNIIKESENGYKWVIKPIDSQINYLHALPYWGSLILLLKDDVIQMAAYYMPMQDDFFITHINAGVFLNGKRLKFIPNNLEIIAGDVKNTNFNIGSVCFHMVYLCSRKIDAIVNKNMNEIEKQFIKLAAFEASVIFDDAKCFVVHENFKKIIEARFI